MKSYDDKTIRKLEIIAVKIRKKIIEMLYRAESGHPGGSLSAVDAMVALYFFQMKHYPKNPKNLSLQKQLFFPPKPTSRKTQGILKKENKQY